MHTLEQILVGSNTQPPTPHLAHHLIIIIIIIIITHLYVVVQVDTWFNFCFLLFQIHYHTLPYPKAKENKI